MQTITLCAAPTDGFRSNKVNAIRAIKVLTNCSVKEGKKIVEDLEQNITATLCCDDSKTIQESLNQLSNMGVIYTAINENQLSIKLKEALMVAIDIQEYGIAKKLLKSMETIRK